MVAFARQPAPKAVVSTVYVELLHNRPVNYQQRRVDAGGAHHTAQVEALVHHRLQRGDDHWHVLRQAAGHNGVDRDALHGGPPAQRRQLGDELVTPPACVGHEAAHQFLRRRHHRQPVGPAGLEHQLNGVIYLSRKHFWNWSKTVLWRSFAHCLRVYGGVWGCQRGDTRFTMTQAW